MILGVPLVRRLPVSAGAAPAVSLDDIMIFDNARNRAQEFFGQLHASVVLAKLVHNPPGAVESFHGTAFSELVRAAEGIPRDAINDNDSAHQLPRSLVDEVVGKRHSRTFLLDQFTVARNENVEALYDAHCGGLG